MTTSRLSLTALAVAITLSGCGGGGSPTGDSSTGTGSSNTLDLASTAFPRGLAVASPTQVDDEAVAQVASTGLSWWRTLGRSIQNVIPSAVAQATPTSAFAARVARIDALLSGSTPVIALVKPEKFLEIDTDASCYGPSLKYNDAAHPNGPGTPARVELPPGDLGLWFETEGSTTEACAAAQFNARMKGATQRSAQALRMLAVLAQKAAASSGGLPAAGAPALDLLSSMPSVPGLTWNAAKIEQSVAGKFLYDIQATFTNSATGLTHKIDLSMSHTTVTAATDYSGLMKYAVTDKYTGGNCPGSGASHDVTWVGTLAYNRGSSAVDLSHRSGMYCGAGSTPGQLAADRGATYESDGQLDPASKLNGSGQGWGNNFSRFAASLNASSEAGKSVYVWQAGPGDNHGRTLQLTIAQLLAGKTAVAHFGFGSDIAAVDSGLIKGMFCNWAGPGNSRTYSERAQQQTMGQSGSTGTWEPLVSNILYAPTNGCTDSSTAAWLDRNDNGTIDTATDGPVTVSGSEPAFLIGKGSSLDIQTALGFTKPSLY